MNYYSLKFVGLKIAGLKTVVSMRKKNLFVINLKSKNSNKSCHFLSIGQTVSVYILSNINL